MDMDTPTKIIVTPLLLLIVVLFPVLAVAQKPPEPSTPLVYIPEGKFVLGMQEQGLLNFIATLDKTYGEITIETAVATVTEFYTEKGLADEKYRILPGDSKGEKDLSPGKG